MSWERGLLGLFFGTFVLLAASRLVPILFLSMTAPLCSMIRKEGMAEKESLFPRLVNLYGIYVVGSFVFSCTAGAIGKFLTTQKELTQPALLLAGAGGLLVVAIARAQAISHGTSVASYLQALFISALAVGGFMLVSESDVLTTVSDSLRNASPDYFLLLLCGALVTMSFVEFFFQLFYAIGPEDFRRVPLHLVRERIEQWEEVEQFWAPWKVERLTDQWIERVVRAQGPQSICWLTNTHPEPHIEKLIEATTAWAERTGGKPCNRTEAKSLVAMNLRVVLPEEAAKDLEKEWPRSIRTLQGERTPRIRLLILNQSAAIIHLPIPHHSGRRDEQSNYAAVVRDPARISEFQAWFEQIWHGSAEIHFRKQFNLIRADPTHVEALAMARHVCRQVFCCHDVSEDELIKDYCAKNAVTRERAQEALKHALAFGILAGNGTKVHASARPRTCHLIDLIEH